LQIAETLIGLGFATCEQGQYEQAAAWLQEGMEIARDLGIQVEIATILLAWAKIAQAGGQPERAALILEATSARFSPLEAFIPPYYLPWRARLASELRAELGDEHLATLRAAAHALPLEELIAIAALGHSKGPRSTASPPTSATH
jgi:hypothetical protein